MSKQRLVFLMILGGAFAALVGCELAVDFDRSKIPADSTDAGALDVFAPGEGGGDTDSGVADSGTPVDASFDGTSFDSSFDGSSFDASFDSSFDGSDGM